VTLANTSQYNHLMADMQGLLSPDQSEGYSQEHAMPNVLTLVSSGLLHSRTHKQSIQRRLADTLEAFAPAEPEDDSQASRLIIIKGLYGTRRSRGRGVPSLIQGLVERMNQPNQPMLLAMTMHRWEVPPVQADEIGTPQSLIRSIALGIRLDDSGRLAGLLSEPYVVKPELKKDSQTASHSPGGKHQSGFIGTFGDPRIGLSKEDDII
jgi:hypothetical protein